jgi:hypothetical protein
MKANRLMLYRKIMDVYCGKITKRVNKMCGQNTEILNFTACGRRYTCSSSYMLLGFKSVDFLGKCVSVDPNAK